MTTRILLALTLLPLVTLPITAEDCSGGEGTPTPTPIPGGPIGSDITVVAFSQIHQQFGNGDTRSVKSSVVFPDDLYLYKTITLNYTLSCPSGGCDPWDRLAYVQVVKNPGAADEQVVEVGRFITPYGVGGSWKLDVTDLRPILAGAREVRSFIDTWVNPGWLVDVSFELTGGVPARRAIDIQPLWSGYYGYGYADDPIANHLLPQTLALVDGARSAAIRVLATGHGQQNSENCAEFCPKDHTLGVNGVYDTLELWRTDCRTSGVSGQSGTYWYSRAGWCPGADVVPRLWEVTSHLSSSASTFEYVVEPYTNTEPNSSGMPYVVITAYLIAFE